MTKAFWVCLFLLAMTSSAMGRSALVYEASPSDFVARLRQKLSDSGFQVVQAGSGDLSDKLEAGTDLLVLVYPRRVPCEFLEPLDRYLKSGGCLVTVGPSAFEDLLQKVDDRWINKEQTMAEVLKKQPSNLLFQFKPGDEKLWVRATNHPEFEEKLSVYDGAMAGYVGEIDGWNFYLGPRLTTPFPPGHELTIFEARGDANTPFLFVEWKEKDGSRWISQVPLTERFKRYSLAPSDFRYLPSVEGRGGKGDRFHPENASQFVVGIAEDFGALPKGRKLWWIRDIGTSPDPVAKLRVEIPRYETISPSYKCYPMSGVRSLRARSDQAVIDNEFTLAGSFEGWMPVWRARGFGYNSEVRNPYRFIPLVDAFDHDGEWIGTAAWMFVHFEGAFKGGIWGGVGVDPSPLKAKDNEGILSVVAAMASRMFSAPFIRSGGASAFAVNQEGSLKIGCVASNLKADRSDVGCEISIAQKGLTSELSRFATVEVDVGSERSWSGHASYQLERGPARVVTKLVTGGRVVDILSQPVSVMTDAAKSASFVRSQGGQFVLDGRPIYANGVNYWPRSSVALEKNQYDLGWLNPWQYDPEVIERDLGALEALKVNLISIQYMDPSQAPQLIDLLERCRVHRILVNIFLNGAHPLDTNLNRVSSLIQAAGLRDNPQVFAYDLAWEPNLGSKVNRDKYDTQWVEWIEEQYGSIERAERDWGFQANRKTDNTVTGPTDEQLTKDGEYRKMVAAYRRFADDLISRRYGVVTRAIRSIDPNHMLGARTGYGGTGQAWIVPRFPYDLASGAAHLDFISPEGYMVGGNLDGFLAAGFTTEYARLVSSGKPVFWSEYGMSIWPNSYDEQTLQSQGGYYKNFYEMFSRSHANGSAAWWYPGGYRVDEDSDYGIMQQSAKPRPAAISIRDGYQKAVSSLALPDPASYIEVDRDRFVDGYAGVWREGRDAYLKSLKQGKRAALRTGGSGTTSKDCPAIAVGGTVWTADNPSRYLNAEISSVQVKGDDGNWSDWEGRSSAVGRSLKLRALLVNTGEALWLKDAGGDGTVYLQATSGSEDHLVPLPGNVAFLGQTYVEFDLDNCPAGSRVFLRMICRGRGPFGQRVTFDIH